MVLGLGIRSEVGDRVGTGVREVLWLGCEISMEMDLGVKSG